MVCVVFGVFFSDSLRFSSASVSTFREFRKHERFDRNAFFVVRQSLNQYFVQVDPVTRENYLALRPVTGFPSPRDANGPSEWRWPAPVQQTSETRLANQEAGALETTILI